MSYRLSTVEDLFEEFARIDRKVALLIYAAAAEAYGGPAHLRNGGEPLVTNCAACGVNADDIGVDPWTELCDDCWAEQ